MNEAFERWWTEKYAGSWKPQGLEDYFKEVARSAWDEALENLKREANYPNNFLKWAEEQQHEADLKREKQLVNIFQRVFDVKPSSVKQFIKSISEEELLEAESWCVKANRFTIENRIIDFQRPTCLNILEDELKVFEGND